MENEKDYVAAELPTNLINEIKSFEEKLRDQTNKEVVIIAYQKDKNGLQ